MIFSLCSTLTLYFDSYHNFSVIFCTLNLLYIQKPHISSRFFSIYLNVKILLSSQILLHNYYILIEFWFRGFFCLCIIILSLYIEFWIGLCHLVFSLCSAVRQLSRTLFSQCFDYLYYLACFLFPNFASYHHSYKTSSPAQIESNLTNHQIWAQSGCSRNRFRIKSKMYEHGDELP